MVRLQRGTKGMKKNEKIKIHLKYAPIGQYRINTMSGAVTVETYDRQTLRAGDKLNEKQAEDLNLRYAVTVTHR